MTAQKYFIINSNFFMVSGPPDLFANGGYICGSQFQFTSPSLGASSDLPKFMPLPIFLFLLNAFVVSACWLYVEMNLFSGQRYPAIKKTIPVKHKVRFILFITSTSRYIFELTFVFQGLRLPLQLFQTSLCPEQELIVQVLQQKTNIMMNAENRNSHMPPLVLSCCCRFNSDYQTNGISLLRVSLV